MGAQVEAEIGIEGAYVKVGDVPLCEGCWSENEVDVQIDRLKADLDRLAGQMKMAIREKVRQVLGEEPVSVA